MSSPNYPGNYPNNINYTRIIYTENPNNSVNFTILDLEAETFGKGSCLDYLRVSVLNLMFYSQIYDIRRK